MGALRDAPTVRLLSLEDSVSQIVPFPSTPDLPGPLHGDDLLPIDVPESPEGDQHTGPPAGGVPRSFYVIRPIEPASPEPNRSA